MSAKLSVEMKYRLYEASVQNPENDVDFIIGEFKRLRGFEPQTLREDFGGTGYTACHWVSRGPEKRAWAIDLDTEPQAYGRKVHQTKLPEADRKRVEYIEGNVLSDYPFKADVSIAFNFSYFIFKERKLLLDYFKKARQGISDKGLFIIDTFGGTECGEPLLEETEHDGHTYYWDCDKFNPLTAHCLYHIHFKHEGKKYEQAFTYDWRHWTVPELCELLLEAGFSKTEVYWEGEDEEGEGDGNFVPAGDVENCESWITYICAIP
jgi:hypothetical protein